MLHKYRIAKASTLCVWLAYAAAAMLNCRFSFLQPPKERWGRDKVFERAEGRSIVCCTMFIDQVFAMDGLSTYGKKIRHQWRTKNFITDITSLYTEEKMRFDINVRNWKIVTAASIAILKNIGYIHSLQGLHILISVLLQHHRLEVWNTYFLDSPRIKQWSSYIIQSSLIYFFYLRFSD